MPKTLLVVDDSATIREAAKLALTGEGWSVLEATTSEEALSILRDESPDAVLCDVALREEDGYELCRRMRSLPEGAGLPVVLMGSKVSAAAAATSGAAGSLVKPFGSDELADTLRSACESGSFELELSDLGFGAPDEGAVVEEQPTDVSVGPAADLEIIDLSSEDEYEELELLEDLEPVAIAAVSPPLDASDLTSADLEDLPALSDGDGSDFEKRALLADDLDGALPLGEEAISSAPDLSPFGEEPESEFGGSPREAGGLEAPAIEPLPEALASALDETPRETPEPQAAEAPEGVPEADALAHSAAQAAEEAIREALHRSLSAENLLPAVEAAVERVVWEVVPSLAERLILEAIEKLRQEPPE